MLIAIVAIRMRDLFGVVILFGVYSLLSAGLFTVMDAVDVAFTEAAVGAGFSTVLFLGTLSLTSSRAKRQRWRPLPLLVVVFLIVVLLLPIVFPLAG